VRFTLQSYKTFASILEAEVLETVGRALALKGEGNRFFGEGEYDEALAEYTRADNLLAPYPPSQPALRSIPPSCRDALRSLAASVALNLAACHLKRVAAAAADGKRRAVESEARRAARRCSAVLRLEPCSVKALFRRAQAAAALGDADAAGHDLRVHRRAHAHRSRALTVLNVANVVGGAAPRSLGWRPATAHWAFFPMHLPGLSCIWTAHPTGPTTTPR
jgi:hypothetical protein